MCFPIFRENKFYSVFYCPIGNYAIHVNTVNTVCMMHKDFDSCSYMKRLIIQLHRESWGDESEAPYQDNFRLVAVPSHCTVRLDYPHMNVI